MQLGCKSKIPYFRAVLEQIDQNLRSHSLRPTKVRRVLMKCFMESEHALDYPELDRLTDSALDKVTIYRNLGSFRDAGLIHEINDGDGPLKYALCQGGCSHDQHADEHLHFKCDKCERVYCLEDSVLPEFRLPAGFIPRELKVIVSGNCAKCA